MRDGKTRKRRSVVGAPRLQEYLDRYATTVMIVSGPGAGAGFVIDRERVIVGRGPGVDRAYDDPAMSRQHAAIEFCGTGFRLRDLGSTNGTVLNGAPVQTAELHHGDRFEIGGRHFVVTVEETREREPDAYELKA
jgi:pSer/pThr/pTyr-binding forkhead associated (FHA) protein